MPTVPGSAGLIQSDEDCEHVAQEVGFPLMIKATAGDCCKPQKNSFLQVDGMLYAMSFEKLGIFYRIRHVFPIDSF